MNYFKIYEYDITSGIYKVSGVKYIRAYDMKDVIDIILIKYNLRNNELKYMFTKDNKKCLYWSNNISGHFKEITRDDYMKCKYGCVKR